jgi:class 3 adenylate cyclase
MLIPILLFVTFIAAGFVLCLAIALRKAKRELAGGRDELVATRHAMDEQKMSLAEASLNLLERTEKLEEQKLKIAEANIQLLELNEQLREEQERSERLLLNILPLSVANDLRSHGKSDPKMYENVSVLFSDLVGFTQMSSKLDPIALIAELNDLFTMFDNIIERHHCERIKTIGDAYLALCGMPTENARHAEAILDSAVEILQCLEERNTRSDIQWKIRIGVHTGQVVGGVVGIKKYIYDVFGDTINTASRMESNSEAMKINVSETTYEIARDNYSFIARNPIEVKGKGLLKMFWLVTPPHQ